MADYAFTNFYDEEKHMFFFTSKEDAKLVTRNYEYRDNVIAASNSIMAKNLFKLSHYFEVQAIQKRVSKCLKMYNLKWKNTHLVFPIGWIY